MKFLISLIFALTLTLAAASTADAKACATNADCTSPERCLDGNHKPGAGSCGIDCKPGVLDCPAGMTCQNQINGVGLCATAPTSPTGGTSEQPQQSDRTVKLVNPLNTSNIPQIIGSIIKAAVGVVGAFALLTFVYGGFLWLTSGGDAGKVEQGKEAMKWAMIGLAVVFSSYALVSFVLSALKL